VNAVEQKQIDDWIDVCQKLQPDCSLAIFLYVRDGKVTIGRGGVPLEMKRFPLYDLPLAASLINTHLSRAAEHGAPDVLVAGETHEKRIPMAGRPVYVDAVQS
jgi:hypothetical protein